MSKTRNTVNTKDEEEIRFWTAKLKTTRERLMHAIARVGNSVPDIEIYLASGSEPIGTRRKKLKTMPGQLTAQPRIGAYQDLYQRTV